jgi:hypothetical protein
MDETKTAAQAQQELSDQIEVEACEHQAEYGERWYYDFHGLRDRFERGLREADRDGDRYVTVKVPSFHELSFPIDTVRKALGR